MECCICYEKWTNEEYEELSDDEKAQTNTCKICNSFVCISCRYDHQKTLSNNLKSFECAICRNMDWKHYYQEEILWWIKHKSLEINHIDDKIIEIYHNKGIFPPPICNIMDKYINI